MKKETIIYTCDICNKEYIKNELEKYNLPVRDFVGDDHMPSGSFPCIDKKELDLCIICAIDIANNIEKLKKLKEI